MKLRQRILILVLLLFGFVFIGIVNHFTYNTYVCRLRSDVIDGPESALKAQDSRLLSTLLAKDVPDNGAQPFSADPKILLERERKIAKLNEIVKHEKELSDKERAKKPSPVWNKIIKRRRINDKHLIPFHMLADQRQLYTESNPDIRVIDSLLHTLATSPIIAVEEIDGGTQVKLNLSLAGGTRALFKPGRFGRDATANPNHYYFSDMERHISEIASYHLDRLLGFRRVPPCAGRFVDLSHDIKRLADKTLKKTFFTSPVGNTCFMSHCDYYCDSAHAICGHPDLIEGSMCVYLADEAYAPRDAVKHPWRRSYSKHRRAEWETDPSYCSNMTSRPLYRNNQRRRLDLIDMAVFDFLISNLDRHHYEAFEYEGDDSFTIILDNGKGFGQPDRDELSILAPLYQCCFIRLSTLSTLLSFHTGSSRLSDLMRRSLSRDQLPTILHEGHLRALDRRLSIILTHVYDCLYNDAGNNLTADNVKGVIIDDIV